MASYLRSASPLPADSDLKAVACLMSAEVSIEMKEKVVVTRKTVLGGLAPAVLAVGSVAGGVTLAAPADAAQSVPAASGASGASAGSEAAGSQAGKAAGAAFAGSKAGAASAGDVSVQGTECWATPGGEWPWTSIVGPHRYFSQCNMMRTQKINQGYPTRSCRWMTWNGQSAYSFYYGFWPA